MTPIELANMLLGIVISVGTVISIAALGIRWLVKHYFEEIKKELKPNSGSSLKDQVTNLEKRLTKAEELDRHSFVRMEKLERKIDDFYDKFLTYLSNNGK